MANRMSKGNLLFWKKLAKSCNTLHRQTLEKHLLLAVMIDNASQSFVNLEALSSFLEQTRNFVSAFWGLNTHHTSNTFYIHERGPKAPSTMDPRKFGL